jgi:membrane-associated protease RseP (regulator of RpoE activity)
VRDPLPQGQADVRSAVRWFAAITAAVVGLALWRPSVAGTAAVLVALLVMIMLHEAGHFVMAKRSGMKVTEFFVGFGPRLWSVRRGETEYGVKVIPAGGYVRIIGMNNLEEVDPADEERTYRSKPFRHRLGVAVAGSTVHLLIAFVLGVALLSAVGILDARPVVQQVVEGSPAAEVGFREGDRILAIDGHQVRRWDDVPGYVQQRPGRTLVFSVQRGTQRLDVPVVPERKKFASGKTGGFVGVGPQEFVKKTALVSAVGESARGVATGVRLASSALGKFFSPSGLRDFSGKFGRSGASNDNNRLLSPVGAGRLANQAVHAGLRYVLDLLISINIFVAVFNMVPLLPLDGGLVAIAIYEKIASTVKRRRVQVDVARLLPITAAVVAIIIVIGISALYLDIVNPAQNPF